MKKRLLIFSVFLLLSFTATTALALDVVLIAHTDVPENSLDRRTTKRIYQGKLTRWTDNTAIVPVMLSGGQVHEEFVEEVLHLTDSRFRTYWRQAVFTGRGIPPQAFQSESDLLRFVRETPGAIGYVSRGADLTGVTVLRLED